MGHIPMIEELAIVAGLGVLVSVLLSRLQLPTVAGLLLAGALAGPHGLALVASSESIFILAEVGVVLLLFTIGLEFSLSRLRRIFKQVALGGSIQVGLTGLVTAGVAVALGKSWSTGIFYGFVFALSSTAIVLRALSERRELDAPHGRFIVGALIFQDLCVVPMLLIVPLLGGSAGDGALWGIALALGKAAAVMAGTVFLARFLVPRGLAWVDASRSRETFLLAILAICIGTAWVTSQAGLSLALGAFLGGIVVADTQFGHRALGDVLPLRDAFMSIFFVSLGMLFDPAVVLAHPGTVALLLAGFVLAKGLLATVSALAMRFPTRAAWLAGVGLAQFGEFGFVLLQVGSAAKIVTPEESSLLLAAGIISMFLTPVLSRIAPHMSAGERLLNPLAKLLGAQSIDEIPREEADKPGHVVIVGYGLAGRMLNQALTACDVPTIVLDLNAEAVSAARARGEHVYYGDATSPEALEHAGLSRALAMVLVTNDPTAARRVVQAARRSAPDVPILVRAQYVLESSELQSLGATEVVANELESGLEILARLLRRLEVPRNLIAEQIAVIRTETQASERNPTLPRNRLGDSRALADLKIESVLLRAGCRAEGQTPVELDLRVRTGALVVASSRDGALKEPPDPTTPLLAGDVIYLVGSSRAVAKAAVYLDEAPGAEEAPRRRATIIGHP